MKLCRGHKRTGTFSESQKQKCNERSNKTRRTFGSGFETVTGHKSTVIRARNRKEVCKRACYIEFSHVTHTLNMYQISASCSNIKHASIDVGPRIPVYTHAYIRPHTTIKVQGTSTYRQFGGMVLSSGSVRYTHRYIGTPRTQQYNNTIHWWKQNRELEEKMQRAEESSKKAVQEAELKLREEISRREAEHQATLRAAVCVCVCVYASMHACVYMYIIIHVHIISGCVVV